jgi:hypothetical protein
MLCEIGRALIRRVAIEQAVAFEPVVIAEDVQAIASVLGYGCSVGCGDC